MSDKMMLSPECITASTAIEKAIKNVYSDVLHLQHLVRQQYDLEWESFEKPAGETVTLDIFKRLDLWARINEACEKALDGKIADLLGMKAMIRETEKKLKAGGKRCLD